MLIIQRGRDGEERAFQEKELHIQSQSHRF